MIETYGVESFIDERMRSASYEENVDAHMKRQIGDKLFNLIELDTIYTIKVSRDERVERPHPASPPWERFGKRIRYYLDLGRAQVMELKVMAPANYAEMKCWPLITTAVEEIKRRAKGRWRRAVSAITEPTKRYFNIIHHRGKKLVAAIERAKWGDLGPNDVEDKAEKSEVD